MIRRWISLLTTGVILLGSVLFPGEVLAESDTESHISILGYESVEEYKSARQSDLYATPLQESNTDDTGSDEFVYPTCYDLREEGLVTSVKSQSPYGTCWAFASTASIESNLVADYADIDLSELFLAYYTFAAEDAFLVADTTPTSVLNNGGNSYILMAMLVGWLGPVSESAYPYGDFSLLSTGKTLYELRQEAEYYVTDLTMLSYDPEDEEERDTAILKMKQAITEGHSLVFSYYECSSYLDKTVYSYYSPTSDIDSLSSGGYHAVTIVGWDDNYSASNFKENPGMDGAWLCKNSWGVNWGDNGYFWISYADLSVVEVYYLDAVNAESYTSNYQYDDLGCWTALAVSDSDESYAYMANVFTAEETSYVTAVMLCTAQDNEDYEITIYTNLKKSSNPKSGTAHVVASGTISEVGYHTITLDEPVKIRSGQKFSVVVKIGGQSGAHLTAESCYSGSITASDGTVTSYSSYTTEEMIFCNYAEGESYYSGDGKEWWDIYEDSVYEWDYTYTDGTYIEERVIIGNLCVKALTNSNAVIFSSYDASLPKGEEITLSSLAGKTIYYSLNGSEECEYTGAITLTEDTQIIAWVEGDSEVYEMTYTIEQALLSSLLLIEEDTNTYLEFVEQSENIFVCVLDRDEILDSLTLQPISTHDIYYDGCSLNSGRLHTLTVVDEKVILTVKESGYTTVLYVIRFDDEIEEYDYPIEEPTQIDTAIRYAPDGNLLGDVNLDGAIDASDASEILVYCARKGAGEDIQDYDEDWLARADFNEDGELNAGDGSELLAYAATVGAS